MTRPKRLLSLLVTTPLCSVVLADMTLIPLFYAGTGRYAAFPGAKFMSNAYGGTAVLDVGSMHHDILFFRVFHNTSFESLLLAHASSGYFTLGSVEQQDWSTVTDQFGTSRVPLTQIFRFASSLVDLHVTVRAKEGEYFRIPFQRNGNIYSDFRANGVRAHVRVSLKAGVEGPDSPPRTLYDDWIASPFSAVEYAYVDPYPATPQHFETLYAPFKQSLAQQTD